MQVGIEQSELAGLLRPSIDTGAGYASNEHGALPNNIQLSAANGANESGKTRASLGMYVVRPEPSVGWVRKDGGMLAVTRRDVARTVDFAIGVGSARFLGSDPVAVAPVSVTWATEPSGVESFDSDGFVWWSVGDASRSTDTYAAAYAVEQLRRRSTDPFDRLARQASQKARSTLFHEFRHSATGLRPKVARSLFKSLRQFRGPAAVWALALREAEGVRKLGGRAEIAITDDDIAAVKDFAEAFLILLATGAAWQHLLGLGRRASRFVPSLLRLTHRAADQAVLVRMRILTKAFSRHAPPVTA